MARLDRLLANLGYGSRKDVQALISGGKVVLDGKILKDVGTKVAVTADLPERMTIRGAPVDPPAPLVLIMHKPLGVVCSGQPEPTASGSMTCCPGAGGSAIRACRRSAGWTRTPRA